jgi:hypothetical protein
MNSPYPQSTPEFRIFIKENGNSALQIRYVNVNVGYTGKWQDIPVVQEINTKQDNQNLQAIA